MAVHINPANPGSTLVLICQITSAIIVQLHLSPCWLACAVAPLFGCQGKHAETGFHRMGAPLLKYQGLFSLV
jgi:hypothetical protein